MHINVPYKIKKTVNKISIENQENNQKLETSNLEDENLDLLGVEQREYLFLKVEE